MSGNDPAAPRTRVALAAFLLFVALLGVARADASLTKAADVAGPSRPALELPATAPAEPSRFGFTEDLALLNVEKEHPRFSLIDGVETRRFERTYSRNNPLTFLDPDGRQYKGAAAVAATGLAFPPTAPIVGAAITVGVVIDLVSPFFGGRSEILTTIDTLKTDLERLLNLGRPATEGVREDVITLSMRKCSSKDRADALEKSKDEDGVPRCAYCGGALVPKAGSGSSYEADHRDAYSRGGPSTRENLAPSCRTCNREKGNKSAEEYKARKGEEPK